MTNPTMFEKYRYWFIGGGIVVLIGIVLFSFQFCDNWSFNRGVEKDKQAVEQKKAEITPLEAQRDALTSQIDEKKGELTVLEKNAVEAQDARIEAQTNSNQKLEAEANIRNQNFNGTSYEDAQKARCDAGFAEACR